jgi:glycosyltransferase involved in cell wall biosynthesis
VNLLFLLTYYEPHLSGLTIAARNRAMALVERGHRVTVICSRHRAELPLEEQLHGVRVLRLPVRWRAGKGVWMPGLGKLLRQEAAQHDALVHCLPASPVEAWWAARVARDSGTPLFLDYACDLRLAGGLPSRMIEALAFQGHRIAAKAARAILVSTQDYASSSPFARQFPGKVRIVPLTLSLPRVREGAARALRAEHAARGEKLIGFAGRIAAEKGLEVLLAAVERLRQSESRAGKPKHAVRLLLAGEAHGVIGEQNYRQRIFGKMEALGDACRVLGVIQPDLAGFFGACDVLVLPSLNRTESFGMVQVEAMVCGTPVVASDLPGVRVPVQRTGMGRLAPPGDVGALAEAIQQVLDCPDDYRVPAEAIEREFAPEKSIRLFEELIQESLP